MSIEVGSKLKGKITGITNFGAFVELPGGSTGLVHISEVADNYVKDINEHLTVGDEVEVKVLNVESDGKIGLSIRKAKDKPAGQSSGHGQGQGRPQRRGGSGPRQQRPRTMSFEDKMNRFLKDSEERLTSLKRQTESKRGSRGTKR
ncbi:MULTISPECIES: S1 domain-containing RNA-binding protein [Alteribacter]|uniref:RNA-binding protein S1 n=1 Tax=Alteribacter keqinensis TaxID=2483800 RepID=A0A3M7TKJ8_9BACI|nr:MULTISPECIES: S1 domain-containing RNA-binding protein [Alteribacter]MBM7097949.1 RNA-binding protein S1 [Alteribacter salitolerans]RNA66033.1 RNA-binding protein S1 [Alteribacter keqinensis]